MGKVFLVSLLSAIVLLFFVNQVAAQPNPGTCEVKRVPNPNGRGVNNVIEDKCLSGFKPDITLGTTNSCKCVEESVVFCEKEGKTCDVNSECNQGDGCSTYECSGARTGAQAQSGTCKDKNAICQENTSKCEVDSDCRDGSQGCADYTCWTVGRGEECRKGQQPTPTPTTEPPSPLPPCAHWVYFYPIKSLDFRLNGLKINDKDYDDPDFKDRKCVAIQTAIGEISTEPQGFVKRIFSFVLGIAGGIALILIMISGYKLMASQGNPEQITASRDQLISAIVGLLFIIFSFVILQVIGVDLLHIPGFTK